MKYFSKILMTVILMLQVHCATLDQRYEKDKEVLNKVCKQILEDSGIKKDSSFSAKKEYRQCLSEYFNNYEKAKLASGNFFGGMSYTIIMLMFFKMFF